MYFSGRISVDPSQLSHIEKVEPTGSFRKLIHVITGGAGAKKIERQTFTALGILEQVSSALAEMKIDNIIRLAHDDIVIYHDKEGKEGDFQEAVDHYDLTINDGMSKFFDRIHLVLEAEDGNFIHLIEVNINRTHAVGIYPIDIKLNSLLKEFKHEEGESEDDLKVKMKNRFSNQEELNQFLKEKELAFDSFAGKLNLALRKHMSIDNVKVNIEKRTIVPKTKDRSAVSKGRRKNPTRDYDPVFDGYYGFGDLLLYSFLFSELMHDHHYHISDTTFIGEEADILGSVGEAGIDMGESSLLDTDLDMGERLEDLEGVEGFDSVADVTESGGDWFDFGGVDFGGGIDI